MEEDDLPKLRTAEEMAGYLALKHANGMKMADVLDLHTRLLAKISLDYSQSWGWRQDQDCPPETRKYFQWMKDGGYFVVDHLLEESDDWYVWEEDTDD
jgi:hypothetical protein